MTLSHSNLILEAGVLKQHLIYCVFKSDLVLSMYFKSYGILFLYIGGILYSLYQDRNDYVKTCKCCIH